MKKIFKNGLLALTLIAGMAFAVPQSTSANPFGDRYKGSVTEHFSDGSGFVVISEYEHHTIMYWYDSDGTYTGFTWLGYDKPSFK